MRIAIIAWGSLIWCPGSLRIRTRWRCHGPELPLEFSRIAADGRLTLAIDPINGTPCQTYWAESAHSDLDLAKANLQEREKCVTANVHSIEATGDAGDGANNSVHDSIRSWLASKAPITAAVWTGLPSNWHEPAKRNREYSVDDAVAYVRKCMNENGSSHDELKRLKEYICNAPRQTQTAARAKIFRFTGWQQAELSETLFEDT